MMDHPDIEALLAGKLLQFLIIIVFGTMVSAVLVR